MEEERVRERKVRNNKPCNHVKPRQTIPEEKTKANQTRKTHYNQLQQPTKLIFSWTKPLYLKRKPTKCPIKTVQTTIPEGFKKKRLQIRHALYDSTAHDFSMYYPMGQNWNILNTNSKSEKQNPSRRPLTKTPNIRLESLEVFFFLFPVFWYLLYRKKKDPKDYRVILGSQGGSSGSGTGGSMW